MPGRSVVVASRRRSSYLQAAGQLSDSRRWSVRWSVRWSAWQTLVHVTALWRIRWHGTLLTYFRLAPNFIKENLSWDRHVTIDALLSSSEQSSRTSDSQLHRHHHHLVYVHCRLRTSRLNWTLITIVSYSSYDTDAVLICFSIDLVDWRTCCAVQTGGSGRRQWNGARPGGV